MILPPRLKSSKRAGDGRVKRHRQITTAVAAGTIAALALAAAASPGTGASQGSIVVV